MTSPTPALYSLSLSHSLGSSRTRIADTNVRHTYTDVNQVFQWDRGEASTVNPGTVASRFYRHGFCERSILTVVGWILKDTQKNEWEEHCFKMSTTREKRRLNMKIRTKTTIENLSLDQATYNIYKSTETEKQTNKQAHRRLAHHYSRENLADKKHRIKIERMRKRKIEARNV